MEPAPSGMHADRDDVRGDHEPLLEPAERPSVMLTANGREHDLRRRRELWEPLIGRQAATTAVVSRWWGQFGFIVLLVLVGVSMGLEAARWTGVPIVVAELVGWPIVLTCFGMAIRLNARAQKQAGLVAGTSPKARPPVNTVDAFNNWRKRSKYARTDPPPLE